MSESSIGNYKGKKIVKVKELNDEWENPTCEVNIILGNYVKKFLLDGLIWYKMGYPLLYKLDENEHPHTATCRCCNKGIKVVQKEQEEQAAFTPYWKIPIIDDDDDEYTIQYKEYLENSSNAITPDLPTKEPDNSLSMGDEHLSTILETKSDEVIKSSVKDLVPIPSESEGIFSDFNDDCTSSDDDYGEDIDYVEASPPDSELVILEEVKDDILHEKLLNINLLIAKIESLNDNSNPDCVFKSPIPVKDFSLRSPILLSLIWMFFYRIRDLLAFIREETKLTSIVMEDILGEPRVHKPNELPTHPTLMLDSDFIPFDDSLGSDLEVSFSSRTRNKIFDPGIFFEVQSKRFLSQDTFSISFIRNPLYLVIETLLPVSSKNEDKVFNPGILSSNLLSHQGKITSDFSESLMMISGGDIPFLDVPLSLFLSLLTSSRMEDRDFLDFEDSRARGFVHHPLDLQSFACVYIWESNIQDLIDFIVSLLHN
ncbi:hypothetical protein Tco_0889837 [Tanacetum coccineum]